MRILIVGYRGLHQVGEHFLSAASALGANALIVEASEAFRAPKAIRAFFWRFLGRRPARLGSFSGAVLAEARAFRPDLVLATGIAPLDSTCLRALRGLGVKVANFLTDDPWNPSHRPPWFLEAVHLYDVVFSPRRANLADLTAAGCRRVEYLPFAFSPSAHELRDRAPEPEFDVFFAGTGDEDRAPLITAIVGSGASVCLFGTYWDRFPSLGCRSRGQGSMEELRTAAMRSRVGLVLVRRANRDGNSMRTFEVPAMGLCPLVEETEEHREIFGPEGESALFFREPSEAVAKLGYLLSNESLRLRLADSARVRVACPRNTYEERLRSILLTVSSDGGGK